MSGHSLECQAMALRAGIVLLAAQGLNNRAIAERLRLEEHCVGRWRRRFARVGIWSLFDRPRLGAPGGPRRKAAGLCLRPAWRRAASSTRTRLRIAVLGGFPACGRCETKRHILVETTGIDSEAVPGNR
jgi:hypothetical protein